jgi:hypothetical protein
VDATAPGAGGDASGATAAESARFGRRYPAAGRAVVSVVCAATAVEVTPARRALLEAVGTVLPAVRRSARVTSSPAGDGLAVSLVADCLVTGGVAADRLVTLGPEPPEGPTAGEITIVTVAGEERTWVEARWTPSPS